MAHSAKASSPWSAEMPSGIHHKKVPSIFYILRFLCTVSGLYIHIPFCRKACTYCDFHFSTNTKGRDEVIAAMRNELLLRRAELGNGPLGSIYFGGGTPSLLPAQQLKGFLDDARGIATIATGAEITVEANPDDITAEVLAAWKDIGVTRVSLGTQSFRDDRLAWMGRAHNAADALKSIDLIAKAGFASWTIDLIYGLPGMTLYEWDEQLTIALDHGMPHLSAYCLTIEPRTVLGDRLKKGMMTHPDDADQAAQFDRLMERMQQAGLVHYEISNFGRKGHFAVHNSNYWKGVPYVGIGPSAHSFDGANRRWNIANNARYTKALASGEQFWEEEELTLEQRVNERIMTGLRTIWGVDLATLGADLRAVEGATIQRYVDSGDLFIRDERLFLTSQGRRFADRIASDLFIAPSAGT